MGNQGFWTGLLNVMVWIFIGTKVSLLLGSQWWIGVLPGAVLGYLTADWKRTKKAVIVSWKKTTSWQLDIKYWKRVKSILPKFFLSAFMPLMSLAIIALIVKEYYESLGQSTNGYIALIALGFMLSCCLLSILFVMISFLLSSDSEDAFDYFEEIVNLSIRYTNPISIFGFLPIMAIFIFPMMSITKILIKMPIIIKKSRQFIALVFSLTCTSNALLSGLSIATGIIIGCLFLASLGVIGGSILFVAGKVCGNIIRKEEICLA